MNNGTRLRLLMALAMIAHVPGHDGSHVVSEPAGLGMAGHEVVRVVHEN